ncbi:MAG: putative rane protein [Pseudonocardiales bacterium]|nr:putative rane protein [Pseudonocardiales bacterium]
MSTTLTEAAISPDTEWRRLSPRMLLVHPVIELGKAVPALAGVFLASGGSGQGFIWSLAGAGVVTVFSLLRWVTTRFRITPEQIQLRRGVLHRSTVAAPLDRVRTVDVTAHLLHRVLGLAKVVVGTGTTDRKGRDRLALDGLSAEAAGRLRAELLHRGQAPVEALDSTLAPVPVEQEIVRLNRAWVRYAPFTLSGAITGLALFGFAWRIVNEAHVDVNRVGPLPTIGDQLRHTPLVVDIAVITLFVLVFVAVASTAGYVLAFWNFRLTRHTGGTLHVSRGLITTRATSIERRRLHGAEVSESILLRWVGSARCVAIATGLKTGRGAEQSSGLLVPPAPRAVVVRVAADVLETSAPLTVVLRPHGEVARRRRLMRAVGGALVLIAFAAMVCWLTGTPLYVWSASLGLLVLAIPLGYDRYRSLGHALADGYVVASSGSLVRRRSAVDRDGVIGWNFTSTYFQRRFGLTTLTATTAAGKQRYRIYDLAEPDAVGFAEQAKPGLVAQFAQPG